MLVSTCSNHPKPCCARLLLPQPVGNHLYHPPQTQTKQSHTKTNESHIKTTESDAKGWLDGVTGDS